MKGKEGLAGGNRVVWKWRKNNLIGHKTLRPQLNQRAHGTEDTSEVSRVKVAFTRSPEFFYQWLSKAGIPDMTFGKPHSVSFNKMWIQFDLRWNHINEKLQHCHFSFSNHEKHIWGYMVRLGALFLPFNFWQALGPEGCVGGKVPSFIDARDVTYSNFSTSLP